MDQAQQTLAILFADIAGSTELYETVGDVEAHRRVAESLGFMAHAVESHGGKVLRTVGDSTLASFSSCDDALQAACAMQELHKQTPLAVRAGFHFGPVIPDKGDVYGNAVNIAARVASFAKTEEITATEFCIAQLSGENRGLATLLDNIMVRGISKPVGIYRITWEADAAMHTRVAQPAVNFAQFNEDTTLVLSTENATFRLNKESGILNVGRDEFDWSAGQIQISDTSTNGTYIQREGQAPLFVRRETVVLNGSGKIGLGCLPDEDASHSLQYSVID